MNRKQRLTDPLVRRLRPGDREYSIRDIMVPSLGVRVHPSGGRSYVHFGEGKRVSLGSATLMTIGHSDHVVTSMIRRGCYQPKRQLLRGIRTRQENTPFHGARKWLVDPSFCRDSHPATSHQLA